MTFYSKKRLIFKFRTRNNNYLIQQYRKKVRPSFNFFCCKNCRYDFGHLVLFGFVLLLLVFKKIMLKLIFLHKLSNNVSLSLVPWDSGTSVARLSPRHLVNLIKLIHHFYTAFLSNCNYFFIACYFAISIIVQQNKPKDFVCSSHNAGFTISPSSAPKPAF